MLPRFFFQFCAATLLISACAPQPGPTSTLNVFAAASLTNAFEEIGAGFEAANPNVNIKFNFGGSQSLRTQIEQGAQADLFASANLKEIEALEKSQLVEAGSAQIFLTNQLVVIFPSPNPAKLTTLADLARPGLKIILAAKEVPAGNYALQVLDQLEPSFGSDYKNRVLANVVSYENDVRQVVAKVQLGEADAGIVYQSDALAAPGVGKIEIPATNNIVAKYPVAALSRAPNPQLARALIAYLLSAEGQAILQKWGFVPVR
jgi:molybdate transport system substrate-binding protein